jgi:prepilin-type N-terminal cleavage/methylation domain-containing protein
VAFGRRRLDGSGDRSPRADAHTPPALADDNRSTDKSVAPEVLTYVSTSAKATRRRCARRDHAAPRLSAMRHPRAGFTLVELLIVIVGLAIIAGMVVPQFGQSLEDAKRSALLNDLHELHTAIERYRIQHDGDPPDDLAGNTLSQLTEATNLYGDTGRGTGFSLGPYIGTGIPKNPLNGSAKVIRAPSVPPANPETYEGWLYDPDSGQIWAGEAKGSFLD